MAEEKELKNLEVLVPFRIKGKSVAKGEVIAKTEFNNKGDWQNLVHMTPPRAKETDAKVGKPAAADEKKKAGAKLPGAE